MQSGKPELSLVALARLSSWGPKDSMTLDRIHSVFMKYQRRLGTTFNDGKV